MSILKKGMIALAIAGLGYAITIKPDGQYFKDIAALFKEKAGTAPAIEINEDDPRVHSLDLKKLRSATP